MTPTLLLILDGWGLTEKGEGNAPWVAATPHLDDLMARCPHSRLAASGREVGLPAGYMGNSEVGHLNIGAGRIVYQDMTRIDVALEDGSLFHNPVLQDVLEKTRRSGGRLHLAGLLSDGGVHSHINHLVALCAMAFAAGVPVRIHCFMDGRDTPPQSGASYVRSLLEQIVSMKDVRVASLAGRFYAMDRDKRWERVKEAYDMLVDGTGKKTDDVVKAVEESYAEGVTDEFIKPIVNETVDGRIKEGHVVIFFNYRNDRAKEMTTVLTQHEEGGMKPVPGLQYYCMTPYDDSFKGVHILFAKSDVPNTLSEYVSAQGKKQLHIAETEKYAHVTFFFNGGREAPFEGEDRILVPSPKVATYDLKPEMSAPEVTEKLVDAIDSDKYDFIVVNFANGDMVGHTGVYEAIQKAVATLDTCVEKVVEAGKKQEYEMIIIADHGNADHALNADGTPNTAHSLNPVPFIYIGSHKDAKCENGRLADVAPSLLKLMGLQQPADMDGHNLIEF